MACFIDERIAKYYFNKCLPNRIEIILFLATLSFARETLGRVNHVEMVVVVCALIGVDLGCSLCVGII